MNKTTQYPSNHLVTNLYCVTCHADLGGFCYAPY